MKEITDILKAYQEAVSAGKNCALATVVNVEGSSYRRPGARMLVTDDGQITGAISGGCLEGDALRKAQLAISDGYNRLVTYDTTDDEDDARFGVQLGCNGIVHILFEPIKTDVANNPLELLKKVAMERRSAVIVTLFNPEHRDIQFGTCLFFDKSEYTINAGVKLDESFITTLVRDAKHVLHEGSSRFTQYEDADHVYSAFIEKITPAIRLFICGAGNDVMPLVRIADLLGWIVIVIDGRKTHTTRQRFPNATKVLVAKSEDVMELAEVDNTTAFLLMTHNYNYDKDMLRQLLEVGCRYIGVLGPRKKTQKMLDELADNGLKVDPGLMAKIHGPVGLDIGAETAEEIALSITAEIMSVMSFANAIPLNRKATSIHSKE